MSVNAAAFAVAALSDHSAHGAIRCNIAVRQRIRFMMRHIREHAKWMKANGPHGAALDDDILRDTTPFANELSTHVKMIEMTGETEGEHRVSKKALVLFEQQYRYLYLKARKHWTPADRDRLKRERAELEVKIAPLRAIMDEITAEIRNDTK